VAPRENPEADIYVGEADGVVCHEFRGLESFLDQERKEQTVLINYDKKKINFTSCSKTVLELSHNKIILFFIILIFNQI